MPVPVSKPKTSPAQLAVLVKIAQSPNSTAQELGVSSVVVGRLVKEELVKVTEKVQTGKRGRPAHRVRVTSKGRGRAQRAMAKVAA